MLHLFSNEGMAALTQLLRQQPLLAFDFDGTLAPIVARPENARISAAVADRLRIIRSRLPVAVVTGRSVDDVRKRLSFAPQYIVGNHGAEDEIDAAGAAAHIGRLSGVRRMLDDRRADLSAVGIVIEDKRHSIALHYRLSRERGRALELIQRLFAEPDPALRIFAGKMVVNIAPSDAPDKALAVHSLLERCGARCAFFAGDDVNDEPVFVSAPPAWLTVRVGHNDGATSARYFLGGTNEMAMLLDRILEFSRSHRSP